MTPCDDSRIQEHCQLSPGASVPGPGAGQCAGVLGHNGTIHLLECSWLRWGHGEREEGGDLEDINTDRDPPGLNDQIKYN